MRFSSRLLRRVLLPALLLLAPMALGCGSSKKTGSGGSGSSDLKRVILLTNGDDPFWDAMRTGMEKGAEEFRLADAGLRVEMDKNDGTPKGQVDKLKQYAGQTDIAAVAVSVTDAENIALANAMKELQKQGVVVITIDSDINRDKFRDARFAYLGTDNIIGGRELGKAAVALRPDGGVYAAFYGLAAAANVIERTSGFAEAAGESFKKADGLSDDMDLTKAAQNVRNVLQNHPDIDTLVGIWAYNAHAIVSVVKERELRDNMKVVVFDAAPKAIQHMNDGFIDAMVVQNPYQMGYLGTKLMMALVENDGSTIEEMYPGYDQETGKFASPDQDILTTELRVVVPDNDSPIKAAQDEFLETTKFFTSEEFNAWLKERDLIGS